jgi:transposase
MKSIEVKEQFIQLRAEGLSYQAIAETLKVSKQTLIEWSKDCQIEIHNFKSVRLEGLYEQYCATKEARIKLIGELLEKVRVELCGRDLSKVRTEWLYDIALKLTDAQNKERDNLTFATPDVFVNSPANSWEVD